MPQVRYVGVAFLQQRAIQAVSEAVGKAAADLEGRSQAVTPVDTGTLRASIHVEGPTISGNEATARVSTGGEASDYAILVHEGTSRMAARKYIERPLLSMLPVYQRYIEDAGKKAF